MSARKRDYVQDNVQKKEREGVGWSGGEDEGKRRSREGEEMEKMNERWERSA